MLNDILDHGHTDIYTHCSGQVYALLLTFGSNDMNNMQADFDSFWVPDYSAFGIQNYCYMC